MNQIGRNTTHDRVIIARIPESQTSRLPPQRRSGAAKERSYRKQGFDHGRQTFTRIKPCIS
ncbi:hypothetical protein AWB75_07044 [Caballeronia catudaia]|uniref:Uncharacterized protein n=1 Tax=Caballeronia catudaia TaxID=1777136 RepID=A0A158DQD3_9BURK|nr:hypothetical protein AWB75_07044 [Caballeronia catudaia]